MFVKVTLGILHDVYSSLVKIILQMGNTMWMQVSRGVVEINQSVNLFIEITHHRIIITE